MEYKITVDSGILLDFLDDCEDGELFPKMIEGETITSVRILRSGDIEFTMGEEKR